MELLIDSIKFILKKGDITQEDVHAIVNAANSSLMGGGGVDGAIHRAGGPIILEECKKIISKIKSLPTGEAVITIGGNLKAQYVIHTVGPIWYNGKRDEQRLLKSAYLNCLRIGVSNNIETIAFPSISTGVYRFPIDLASKIAFNTTVDFVKNNNHNYKEIRFVTFSDYDYSIYEKFFL